MNFDDYLSTMTIGMVRAADRRAAGLAILANQFELDQPCQADSQSLAVRGADGALIGYRAWLNGFIGPATAGAVVLQTDGAALPPHIAEAFAGANPRVIVAGQRMYLLDTLRSSAYAMTGADFATWASTQPAADAVLERVTARINADGELNGREPVSVKNIQTYLASPEGEQVFEQLAPSLVREVQLAVRNSGHTLVTPDEEEWFSEPLDMNEYFTGINEDEQLELTGEVTASDLTAIFDAQTCRDEVWTAVREGLALWYPDTDLNDVPDDQIGLIHQGLLSRMQMVCHDLGVDVVHPPEFADRLGTRFDHMSESERREHLPSRELLVLERNPQVWECWYFRDIAAATASHDTPADTSAATASAELLDALNQITDLAQRMQSGFAEAFATAAWVLHAPEALALFAPETRDAALENLSDRAQHVLYRELGSIDHFAAVGYTVPALRMLLACDLASVFHGMNSWNDEMPPDELADQHAQLSARVFSGIERLRKIVL
jgi:hypothetical protein